MTSTPLPFEISESFLAVLQQALGLFTTDTASLSDWCDEANELLDDDDADDDDAEDDDAEDDDDDDDDSYDEAAFEELLTAAFGSLDEVVAFTPGSLGWYLAVPTERATGRGCTLGGPVVLIGTYGEPQVTDWRSIRADRSLWFGTDGAVVSGEWSSVEQLPFAFSASAWEGTRTDHAFGDGDALLHLNGEEVEFDIEAVDLRYRTPAEVHLPEGLLLEVVSDGESMSTGDIGLTISVDSGGALWVSMWGYADVFVGRPAEPCTVVDAIDVALAAVGDEAEVPIDSIVMISSDILGVEEMRVAVTRVRERDVNARELDEIEVQCVSFEGTAGDLMDSSPDE